METDSAYFSRRASEERRAAMQCVDPRAREAHLALVERYQNLADEISTHERSLGLSMANGRSALI
jgi:hypothetical protein